MVLVKKWNGDVRRHLISQRMGRNIFENRETGAVPQAYATHCFVSVCFGHLSRQAGNITVLRNEICCRFDLAYAMFGPRNARIGQNCEPIP